MPGSMFSWESEDMLVDEYEAAIKENREPSVAMHFAGLVIAVALHRFDEDWRHREGWRPIREHLRTTLRALDALPIIAKNELKQNKNVMIPGIVKLKVSGIKLKAFPSRALKAGILNGHRSSSSSSETLQLPSPPSPSPPSAPSPRSLAWYCPLACSVARGRKRKAEEE